MKSKIRSTTIVAFMGVDGSGKSTLIKTLIKKFKKKYKYIKYIHLRPYLFLIDKSTVNSDPHKKKKLTSKFTSLFTILLWLVIYKFFFLCVFRKKNQLVIFDRYAHDLLIDKVRYQFNLSKKYTELILNLFPEPHLWIFLKAPISILENRKKELPQSELKKQIKKYINFSKSKKNSIIVNTNAPIQKNISLIVKNINTILV